MPYESINFTSFAFVLQPVVYMLNTRPRSSLRLLGKYPFTLDRSDRCGSDEILDLAEGDSHVDTKTQVGFWEGRVSEPTSWTA